MARSLLAALALLLTTSPLVLTARAPNDVEGRAPTYSQLTPAVEAAFVQESYAPETTATLVVSNRARGLRLQIFRSGPERVGTYGDVTMNGVPVTPRLPIGSSPRVGVPVRIGAWPSGLYFARLRAADGRVGFAPFVVRPRRLGEHRVAIVLPTLTWQAYNLRDENGDGRGDSWYADSRTSHGSARAAVPQPWRAHRLPALRPAFPELAGANRKAGRRALPVGSRVSLERERTRRGL